MTQYISLRIVFKIITKQIHHVTQVSKTCYHLLSQISNACSLWQKHAIVAASLCVMCVIVVVLHVA